MFPFKWFCHPDITNGRFGNTTEVEAVDKIDGHSATKTRGTRCLSRSWKGSNSMAARSLPCKVELGLRVRVDVLSMLGTKFHYHGRA